MRKILVVVIVFVLLVTPGLAWLQLQLPIRTGVDGYSGIERAYARDAIYKTKAPAGLLARSYRVTRLERCPQHPPTCGPPIRRDGTLRENPSCEGEPFAAEVEMSTIFGLPFGKVSINCGGTVGFASGERARS